MSSFCYFNYDCLYIQGVPFELSLNLFIIEKNVSNIAFSRFYGLYWQILSITSKISEWSSKYLIFIQTNVWRDEFIDLNTLVFQGRSKFNKYLLKWKWKFFSRKWKMSRFLEFSSKRRQKNPTSSFWGSLRRGDFKSILVSVTKKSLSTLSKDRQTYCDNSQRFREETLSRRNLCPHFAICCIVWNKTNDACTRWAQLYNSYDFILQNYNSFNF